MPYEGLDVFVTKVTVGEISRWSDGGSDVDIDRVTKNVISFCEGGVISPNQLAVITDALDVDIDVPEYEPPRTEEGQTLQDVANDLADLTDGVAELGELLSGIIDPEEE